jgi:hypothetical protein
MQRPQNERFLRITAFFVLLTILCCSFLSRPGRGAYANDQSGLPEKNAGKDHISTITYPVGDLVGVRSLWRRSSSLIAGARQEKAEGIDVLVRTIMTVIDRDKWDAKQGAYSLQELNGKQLEIRTSAENHKAINELLTALHRRADLAVIVESDLYEVERGFYQKQIEPVLAKGEGAQEKRFAAVVEESVARQLRDHGKLLRSNKVTVLNQETEKTFSWRTAFNYQARPKSKDPENSAYLQTAFHGMTFETGVNVTADRRLVDVKLAQHTRELIDIGKELVADPATGDDVNVDVPRFLALSTSMTLRAEDGQPIVVPVHYRPPGVGNKERLLILLVRPVIYIEEEERIRKKGGH